MPTNMVVVVCWHVAWVVPHDAMPWCDTPSRASPACLLARLPAYLQVLFREDATVDDLIDVIEGNRKYIKCVYVYNKIDVMGIDDVDRLARQPHSVVISANMRVRATALW